MYFLSGKSLFEIEQTSFDGKNHFPIDCDGVYVICSSPLVFAGDANGDGRITIHDAARILQYLAKWDVRINLQLSDTDASGNVSVIDSTAILKYIVGWDIKLN